MQTAINAPGLTTARAPFIDEARASGELFVHQPYELYSSTNHRTWAELHRRLLPRWKRYANKKFLEGVDRLALDPDHVPRFEDVNRFLSPLSGFVAKPVSGYVPAYLFFDCLRRREFPTTITIRDFSCLDYLPEPDIFHDLAGHVPMHTDRLFSDVLVRFGEVAHTAARLSSGRGQDSGSLRELEGIIRALARFFWFTVEFGLMRGDEGRFEAYGSGLLSSYEEIATSIESPAVQRHPFRLEWVINQGFAIDRVQPLLFVVESFEHLYFEVDRLEEWMLEGRLGNVAVGEPVVGEADLHSFLEAGRAD